MNCLALTSDVGERAGVIRDADGVPVEWTLLRVGDNPICQEGRDGSITLRAEDMRSIVEYHHKKGELIPVDSEHYLFALAQSKKLDEAEALRLFPGAVAGLHLTSVQYGETCSTAEAVDEDGNVEQVDVYAKKRTVSGQGNIVSGGSLAALTVGGTLEIGGQSYLITSAGKAYGPNQHATVNFSGEAPMVTSGGTVTSGDQVSG